VSTCRVCGRQLEETPDHAPMPCVCVLYPLEAPIPGAYCPTCCALVEVVGMCGECGWREGQ
jgi:hypothetical protein